MGIKKKKKKRISNRPFDAVGCCVAEAPDVIVVAVHRASASKHHAVTRQTRNLQEHNLITQAAVHLEWQRSYQQ